MTVNWSTWATPSDEVPQLFVREINPITRQTYRNEPDQIEADRTVVAIISQGDYRHRQIFELIQNAADAILEDRSLINGGRIKLILTASGLYCANEGAPFSQKGIRKLRFPIASTKTGNQIGRYGQGFKSVLAITNQPHIFSRTGSFSFRFDDVVEYLSERLEDGSPGLGKELFGTSERPKVSIFVVPKPEDPKLHAERDPILEELMEWATTVIYLPFVKDNYYSDVPPFEHLKREIDSFPSNFLVFAGHVTRLDFEIHDIDKINSRSFTCEIKSTECIVPFVDEDAKRFGKNEIQIRHCSVLCDGDPTAGDWIVFTDENVDISSVGRFGIEHNRRMDDAGGYLPVQVSWAVRMNFSGASRGEFWFHFPTKDWTSLAGILNAPWDTNSERTKVLENRFNEYLIERVGHLVHQSIPTIAAHAAGDYGKIFDLVPARAAEAEGVSKTLALRVPMIAQAYASIPDVDGVLRRPAELRRYPVKVTEFNNDHSSEWAQIWAMAPGVPKNFAHWTCLTSQNRKARLANWLATEIRSRSRDE